MDIVRMETYCCDERFMLVYLGYLKETGLAKSTASKHATDPRLLDVTQLLIYMRIRCRDLCKTPSNALPTRWTDFR